MESLIARISAKAEIDIDKCEGVIHALGDPCERRGKSLAEKLKNRHHHQTGTPEEISINPLTGNTIVENHTIDLVEEISEKTGYCMNDCEKIIHALRKEVEPGALEKLKFWKHH
jgi:hypothetical protein